MGQPKAPTESGELWEGSLGLPLAIPRGTGSVGGSWTGGSELDNCSLSPSHHFFSVPRASLLIRAWSHPASSHAATMEQPAMVQRPQVRPPACSPRKHLHCLIAALCGPAAARRPRSADRWHVQAVTVVPSPTLAQQMQQSPPRRPTVQPAAGGPQQQGQGSPLLPTKRALW